VNDLMNLNNENIRHNFYQTNSHNHQHHHSLNSHSHLNHLNNNNSQIVQPNSQHQQQLSPPESSSNQIWPLPNSIYQSSSCSISNNNNSIFNKLIMGMSNLKFVEFSGFLEKKRDPEIVIF
jgi:hypothetical protein